MADDFKEQWEVILAHGLRTGTLVPIIQWLFRRINEAPVRAKIDALPKSHRDKVLFAIERVAREWDADGRVSEEAISDFSRNGWWLPEVLPVLPPQLRKRVEELVSQVRPN